MRERSTSPWPVGSVMVVSDASDAARAAVSWAAGLAAGSAAELHLVRVRVGSKSAAGDGSAVTLESVAAEARDLAGERGHGRVVADADPVPAILAAADDEGVDVLVVPNTGMRGRREFLAGNVANRLTHLAPCTVVVVDGRSGSAASDPGVVRSIRGRTDDTPGRADQRSEPPWLTARTAKIGVVFARHGLRELFGGPAPDGGAGEARRARRLREALEDLGPTFAKLGQLLSTRPDLVPPEYITELAELQDRVPPMPESDVVAVLEQELGVPWEDVFESIEPEPLAAGTIAQVHRARLAGGEKAVVKVQRPGARSEIEQDLALLELFAERAAKRPGLSQVLDARGVFGHLSSSLQRELDFGLELENMVRLREALAGYPRLGVPRVHPELSTGRLLTMEEIEGGPVVAAPDGRPRREAGRQLLESYYRQILVDGFFHADPHPGNLLWANERIYFLDLGMVGEVPADIRRQLILLLLAFWQGDAPFLTDVVLALASQHDHGDLDVEAFQADMTALMGRYRTASLREMQLGPILQEMTSISIRHGVRLPAPLALAGKALAQMQLVAAQLDPDLDPIEIAGRFLMRTTLRGLGRDAVRRADPNVLYYQAQRLRVRAGRIVAALERLIGAKPGQKLEVSFRAERLEAAVRDAGRRLTIGLVAASAILGAAFTSISDRAAGWVPEVFGAVSVVFVAWLTVDLLRRRD